MDISRIIAGISSFVKIKTGRTCKLMRNNTKTSSFKTPEIFLAVSRMLEETFFFTFEVAAGILKMGTFVFKFTMLN